MPGRSLRPLVKRLQMAIAARQGRTLSVSTFTTFSRASRRTVTKYVLSELDQASGRYRAIMSTWLLPDLVKAMAAMLGDSSGADAIADDPPEHGLSGADDSSTADHVQHDGDSRAADASGQLRSGRRSPGKRTGPRIMADSRTARGQAERDKGTP